MTYYNYLIVGGGMTADSAVTGIREIDSRGSIGLVSCESNAPYDRPPLTKGLWKDKQLDDIWRRTEKQNRELHLGRTIVALDLSARCATDDSGTAYRYDKLLLATGGRPRRLPFGNGHIIYFRTVNDYLQLRKLSDRRDRIVVIGGGFIGSEIAASLAMNGSQVTMIFPDPGIGGRAFPPELSHHLNELYRAKGVEVLAGHSVEGMKEKQDGFALKLKGGKEAMTDAVVAGIGIESNVELALKARLKVQNGIVVDAYLHNKHSARFCGRRCRKLL